MKTFWIAVTAVAVWSSSAASVFAAEDRTEAVLAAMRAKGLQELKVFNAAGITINLYTTAASRGIIERREFDMADPAFDQARFFQFVTERFTDALVYFRKVVPADVIRELHLVIDDFGDGRKNSISETAILSRVISSDIRRWHKFLLGNRPFLADLTTIHEFTHVNNYFLDSGEVKRHREMAAIVFESLNLIRLYGEADYRRNYLGKVSGRLASRKLVLGDEYNGYASLRHIVHFLVRKVLDGAYSVTGDRMQALQELARLYLSEKATGMSGFDVAAQKAGVTHPSGSTLTLEKAQRDLYEELPPDPATDKK